MSLEDAVKDPSVRVQLEGVRDLLVNELEGNRCKSCQAIKLRMSDTASMVGKLIGVLEKLAVIKAAGDAEDTDDIEEILSMAVGDTVVSFDPAERQRTRKKRDE